MAALSVALLKGAPLLHCTEASIGPGEMVPCLWCGLVLTVSYLVANDEVYVDQSRLRHVMETYVSCVGMLEGPAR